MADGVKMVPVVCRRHQVYLPDCATPSELRQFIVQHAMCIVDDDQWFLGNIDTTGYCSVLAPEEELSRVVLDS